MTPTYQYKLLLCCFLHTHLQEAYGQSPYHAGLLELLDVLHLWHHYMLVWLHPMISFYRV